MLLNNIIRSADLCLLRSSLSGRRVVLGTGCFDLLHTGHLYFLWEASQQGDVLVIGLNSDGAIRAMKGPSRPIIRQEQRVALVATIRYVDLAFIYDDVVADDCIRDLEPDVYVIGEESVKGYPSELAAAHSVGARIHVVKRIPEVSTTAVIVDILDKSQSANRQ